MGFTLTPFSVQSHKVKPSSTLEPAGAGNRCVMLKQGYIELPSMLEDNIVLSDNSIKDHKWFFQFDDVDKTLLIEKKKQLIEPFLTHGLLFGSFRKNFRSSLVLELKWEKEINFKFENFTTPVKKVKFYIIIKKYLSYLIRNNKLAFIVFFIICFSVINYFIL